MFLQRPHLGTARSRAAPSPAGCSSPAGPRRAAPPPAVEESRAAAPPSGPHRTGSVAEAPRRTRPPAVTTTEQSVNRATSLLCSGEEFHRIFFWVWKHFANLRTQTLKCENNCTIWKLPTVRCCECCRHNYASLKGCKTSTTPPPRLLLPTNT